MDDNMFKNGCNKKKFIQTIPKKQNNWKIN